MPTDETGEKGVAFDYLIFIEGSILVPVIICFLWANEKKLVTYAKGMGAA
jgi:hypothetical protein